MVCSRVFVFLSVTLCFVACLCAQATVSEAEAITAINDADLSIVKVSKMAERELKEAEIVKRDMEWYESKAEKRVSEAEEAAQAAVAAADAALVAANNNNRDPAVQAARQKRNAAQETARNQKYKLQNARTAYPNARADADRAIQSLNDAFSKARKLDEKEEIKALFVPDSPIDYSTVKESALSLKSKAEALEEEINNAKKLLGGAKAIILEMPAPTTEERIEKYKADSVPVAAVLDNIVEEADNIMFSIEYHKNQINVSVQTITRMLQKNPRILSPLLNGFLTTAQDDLVTISQTVNKVLKAQKKIMQLKKYAEESKANLKRKKDESNARRELRNIKYYTESSASVVEGMKETLQSTGQSVRSAQNQVQSAAKVYFENEEALNAEVNAATEKPAKVVEDTNIRPSNQEEEQKTAQKTEQPVEATTVKHTNNNAVQLSNQQNQGEPAEEERTTPTRKNPSVPTHNKPNQLPGEQITKPTSNTVQGQTVNKSEQSAEGDTDSAQKNATVKPTMINTEKEITETSQNSAHQEEDKREGEKTVQKKDKNSDVLNLDRLTKGAKNVTKVPFFGENVPESGAWSDGSMIVCVPLLVALIASVVLH